MNRGLVLAGSALFFTLAGALPAQAQTPLVTGSVRDQHGNAIAGATIEGVGAAAARPVAVTTTDGAGTFALEAGGIVAVRIACRYCAAASVAVVADRPVVAIVERYDAVMDPRPSAADLSNLPYAHVESAVALAPFSLLQQFSNPAVGSQLSDRGLEPGNALTIDAGVPRYDVAYGSSAFATIPAAYEQTAVLAPASDAFTYGDRAGAGIVALSPFGEQDAPLDGVALGGGDAVGRVTVASGPSQFAIGSFSNAFESRQRGDAAISLPVSAAESVNVDAGSSQGRMFGTASQDATSASFDYANFTFDDAQPGSNAYASFVADRGTFADGTYADAASDAWSDSTLTAGVRTRGPVAAFADVSSRFSTGMVTPGAYADATYPAYGVAGTIAQNRIDAGVDAAGQSYDLTAGVGWFGVSYAGGSGYGSVAPVDAHLVTPSVRLLLLPQSKWSASIEASESFTLPTLWQQYGAYAYGDAGLDMDRNALTAVTLSYTDDARVRASFEAATERVRGSTDGTVTSGGISIAWQIAPTIALRAWTMHVDDAAIGALPTTPGYAPAGTPTVGALWGTYENPSGIRIDAIYRRDLLDGHPFLHADGAVSGPLLRRVRWYAGAEDRQRTTFLDIGIRLTP